MKKNNVDFDFQFRVRKYLEYMSAEMSDKIKEEKILNLLSKSIKDEFLFQLYGKILLKIPLFANNFSKKFVNTLASVVKRIDIAPEELVINVFFNFCYC